MIGSVAAIKEEALSNGACDLIRQVNSIEGLVKLMMTPQGREFCKKHHFPSLITLRELKAELADFNIYIDAGFITLKNHNNIVLAGDTHATLLYAATDKPYNVMVFEGADAKVIAKDYTVCQVTNVGGTVEPVQINNANIYIR